MRKIEMDEASYEALGEMIYQIADAWLHDDTGVMDIERISGAIQKGDWISEEFTEILRNVVEFNVDCYRDEWEHRATCWRNQREKVRKDA